MAGQWSFVSLERDSRVCWIPQEPPRHRGCGETAGQGNPDRLAGHCGRRLGFAEFRQRQHGDRSPARHTQRVSEAGQDQANGKGKAMSTRRMDPRKIMELAGTACFGRRWKAELADTLGVGMRFMNRALQEENPTAVIKEEHRVGMLELIDKRIALLQKTKERLEAQPPIEAT